MLSGPCGAGECVGTAVPSGERRRFAAGGCKSPRSIRKECKPLVVLVGILEALRGAGAAMGEASGLHSSPDARDGPACGVLFSIATWRTTALTTVKTVGPR